MIKLNALKNKFDLSTGQFWLFSVLSVSFLGGCLALLIPASQNLIILFGEFIVHRQLNHPVWIGRFIEKGVTGIAFYIFFFFVLFYKNIFQKAAVAKFFYLFMAAFSAYVIFIIMFRANWIFGDDHEYITSTAVNTYISPYLGGGRFAILGHIHYNVPLFFFRLFGFTSGLPVEAHFALIALFYAITVLCLYLLFNRIEPSGCQKHPAFAVFFACTFILLSRVFCQVFTELIYPETVVIMLFAVFMFLYKAALETGKKGYYAAAVLAAVYASYCKEPVFGVFLIIALTNYILRYKKLSKPEHIFYAALVVNGIVYMVLYYFLSFRNASEFYNEGRVSRSYFIFIVYIFKESPVLILMFIVGLIRLSFVVIKKDYSRLYHDGFLFAGMGYVCAYILLYLNGSYYFLPAIILFLPSLVYWTKYLYQAKKLYVICLFAFLMGLYINNNWIVDDTGSVWHERRTFIPYIDDLLEEYNKGKEFVWYESDNAATDNTFYTAVRNWRRYTSNAFLNYRNGSMGEIFFTVKNNLNAINMGKAMLFFYPKDNDQYQPMPDKLAKTLANNHFELYKNSYNILIYRRR